MGNQAGLGPLLALALTACAEKPTVDQIAQVSMIGLSKRDILVCMGAPAGRLAPAERTEIWTYAVGHTTTATPPWAAGLDFSLSKPAGPSHVKIVLTNARVSQVAYRMPDGGALSSGRQCTFCFQACASLRERL